MAFQGKFFPIQVWFHHKPFTRMSPPVKMAWYWPHCVGVSVCYGQGEILVYEMGKKNRVYIMNKKASLINQEFILLREVNTVM